MGFPLVTSFGWAEIPPGQQDVSLPPVVLPNDVFTNDGLLQPSRHLCHLRIYEATIDANADVVAVIADAIRAEPSGRLTAQIAAAQAVMRDEGLVGEWRPSTITIYKFRSNFLSQPFLQNVSAIAAWDVDQLHRVYSTESFALSVTNLSPATRFVWPHLLFKLCSETCPCQRGT